MAPTPLDRTLGGLARWLAAAAMVGLCAGGAPLLGTASTQSSMASPAFDPLPIEDLEELLGPIALYPDSLLANVLAAAVFPDDLLEAYAISSRGGDPVNEPEPDWDPSIAAVSAFPEVLRMLATSIEWTTAVGEAYLLQGQDVLDAIQSLRAIAWNNGALRSGVQQTVVREGTTIIIEPADPQIIYVPVFNPQVVFVPQPTVVPVITFGVGVAVGAIWWSNVHCNWRGGCVAWGPGWWHRGNVRINDNRRINVDNSITIGGGDRNITVNRPENRPGGRPGADGGRWQPDRDRLPRPDRRRSLEDFRGISRGDAPGASRVPGRSPGGVSGRAPGSGSQARPDRPSITRPEARPSRPPQITQRPSAPQVRPSDRPATRPSIPRPNNVAPPPGGARPGAAPGSRPSARPTAPSRPSAAPSRPSGFQPGAGSGSRAATPRPAGGSRPGGRR